MVTKAYIEEVVSENEVRVRCPAFDGIKGNGTMTVDLSSAPLSSIPGASFNLKTGDVIFVGFENNSRYNPVMLGYLSDVNQDTYTDISSKSISINEASFTEDTSIGNITGNELKCLENLDESVVDYLDSAESSIKNQSEKNEEILKKIEEHLTKLDELKTEIGSVSEKIDIFNGEIGSETDTDESTIYGTINTQVNLIQEISDLIGQVPEGQTISGMVDDLKSLCEEVSSLIEEANSNLSQASTNPSGNYPIEAGSQDSVDSSNPMVQRAEKMINVQWTAKSDFKQWNSSSYFKSGTTYTGMPYTLWGYGYSYDSWLANSDNNETISGNASGYGYREGPKYGSCCADFVSEVVGLPSIIRSCSGLASSSSFTKLTGENAKMDKIQFGDVLLSSSGGHVVWVGGITDDSITIYEQTPPLAKKTTYSKSSSNSNGYFSNYTTILRP